MKLSLCIFLIILLSGCASKSTFPSAEDIAQYQMSAQQGDAKAQFQLGRIYYFGDGVDQNKALGLEWMEKAANQGNAEIMHSVAIYHERYDNKKAIEWFQKAADLGYVKSLQDLGYIYEKGTYGVKRDLEKALSYYLKANTDWSKKQYEEVIKLQECNKKNGVTKLFDVLLVCANRNDLRVAAKKAGAYLLDEMPYFTWDDQYNSTRVLKGSRNLEILYTADNLFARAKYTFPDERGESQINKVFTFVADKYGQPNNSIYTTSMGHVDYRWKLEDGIILSVSQDQNDNASFLSYTYDTNFSEMKAHQERSKQAREAKEVEKYRRQNNAF